MTFPRTTHALREALERHGVSPRKAHGQHFLTDAQAVDAIVRDAGVVAADRVVEVGTGPGLLTHALAETGAEVISFEIDPEIQAVARSLREWPATVSFRTGDVLAGKHALDAEFAAELSRPPPAPGTLKLVSNLPYGAGTPILLGVLSLPVPPDELVVMLQEEVAEKLLAPPGGGDYGAPSVAAGLKARGRLLRRFGPEVFWPRPRVRSALVRLVPLRPSPLAPAEHRPFGEFTTALFAHRRTVMGTCLRFAVPGLPAPAAERALLSTGVPPTARVEALAPETILAVWRALGPVPGGGGRAEYGGPPPTA
jgi:16S rRNA (adenine1518-N6/adenine1519-N6)-dimethyltransferase